MAAPQPLDALRVQAAGQPVGYQDVGSARLISGLAKAPSEALGNVAGQLNRAGDTVQHTVLQQAVLANESMARDANTSTSKQINDLWANYGSLEGKAAVDAYPKFQTDLAGLKESALAAMPNPAAKRMLEQSIDSQLRYADASGVAHRIDQNKQWSLTSSGANAAQAVSNATLYRKDPGMVDSAVKSGEGEIVNQAEVHGWDAATTKQKVAEYRGSAYRTVIANLVTEDPIRAQSLFDSVRDTLDPQSQAIIADDLKPKVLNAKADAIAATITAGGTYKDKVRGAESGSQGATASNPNSTAQGDFQFTAPTWKDMQQRHPELGLTDDGRRDSAQQEKAFDAFTEDNKRVLTSSIGHTPNDGELYLGHFLGVGDATKVLNAGDATPIADVVDKDSIAANKSVLEGKTVGQVKAWAQAKMGGPGLPLDSDTMLNKAMTATAGDPELQQRTVSKVSQFINITEAAQAQERAHLTQTLADLEPALLAGQAVPIPETDIRRLLPPDKAQQTIDNLQLASTAGDIFKSVQFATPDQIEGMRADLVAGKGVISSLLRGKQGFLLGPNGDVAPGDQAADFRTRSKVAKLLDERLAARKSALDSDPAQYVLADPNVASLYPQAGSSPLAWAQYVTASKAVQSRLGLADSQQSVLPKQRQTAIISQIQQKDPHVAADFFTQLQQQTGDAWGDVFGDISRGPGAISKSYQALALIQDPVARTTLADVLTTEKDDPGATRRFAKDAKTIDDDVETGMADFRRTFSEAAGGDALANSMTEAARLIAYKFAGTVGTDEATKRATESITGLYDLEISEGSYVARAPRGFGNQMVAASEATRGSLPAGDLLPVRDRQGIYSADDILKATEDNARKGVWVTSPNADGWTLRGADGDVVKRRNGQPVELTYDEAKRMNTQVQTSPEGTPVGTDVQQYQRNTVGPSLGPAPSTDMSPFGPLQDGTE